LAGCSAASGFSGVCSDGLTIVIADHHDDEFRFLGRNDFACDLRPLGVPASIVADEAGIGAMFAYDPDLGFLGKGIFEAMSQPIGVAVAHDHHRDGGFRLLLRGCGSARIISRRFAILLARTSRLEPAAERIVELLLPVRPLTPVPELSLGRP
jgi:hypothetical protein